MAKHLPSAPPSSEPYIGSIREQSLDQALGERYLSYALSTIVARSLPDARDGLKPVQRRILYAMNESGNTSDKSFKKSASAVGYVMMKYHPHGDGAIYDALVRMAQPFLTRYPLILGQGNFGSIDGDNAAAMRYTESRLSQVSSMLLQSIHQDAVTFCATYNSETQEPNVLPTRFPNLLANGATGIAVGMATNIPPHNVNELCSALLHLIKHPNVGTDALMKHLPGPDFPTGGIIVEPAESLKQTYDTGRGSIRLRARYEIEKRAQGAYQIVITEIPYQVQKARLIEKIAQLWNDKKLPLLGDINDESTNDIRLVLTPKSRSIDPEVLMASLFQASDLEIRFSVNMNMLDHGRIPRVMNLKETLTAFLNHQQNILLRITDHRIKEIDKRLEILRGLMVVFLNLDEVIRIIRHEDHPKDKLKECFSLTDFQVEAILNTKLRALRKLEEMQLRSELENLETERQDLMTLKGDEMRQWQRISDDIKKLKKDFGTQTPLGARRSNFGSAPTDDIKIPQAFIEREPLTIICSKNGWIRALKGHNLAHTDFKYKEGDQQKFILEVMSTDKLVLFESTGRFYTLPMDRIPGGRGHGDPITLMVDLQKDAEIVTILNFCPEDKTRSMLLVASNDGRGFQVPLQSVLAQTKSGKQILNLTSPKKAVICHKIDASHDHVAVIGNNRKLLIFPLQDIPEMTRGRGVILQKYNEGSLCDLTTFKVSLGLSWQLGERRRTETDLSLWKGRRGQIGRQPPQGFPRTNRFTFP